MYFQYSFVLIIYILVNSTNVVIICEEVKNRQYAGVLHRFNVNFIFLLKFCPVTANRTKYLPENTSVRL